MIPVDTRAHVDAYWASFFGCSAETLYAPGAHFLPHAALEGYPGILLFRRDCSLIVSTPAAVLDQVRARLSGTIEEIFDSKMLIRSLHGAVRNTIGPAWLGYADATTFAPADPRGTRLLTDADDAALRVLAASCTRTEWEHIGLEFGSGEIMGVFVERRLAAAGRLVPHDERIVDLGILTARAERGRGYGLAVASALAARAVERGFIVQFRTLLENAPSLAIARRLGYQPYAETIAVQLHRL